MKNKLIGFPAADVPSSGVVATSELNLYGLIAGGWDRYRGSLGDITSGAGMGKSLIEVSASPAPCSAGELTGPAGQGKRRVRARRARGSAGTGNAEIDQCADPEVLAAAEAEAWVNTAGRDELAAALRAEQEDGWRVLTLAGGKGWGQPGVQVWINGGGMAARAGRDMLKRRGCVPSDTSLQDGAAAAAAAMFTAALDWFALCGDPDCLQFEGGRMIGTTERFPWRSGFIRYLACAGWRAAWRSFRSDASPLSGRQSDQAAGLVLPLTECGLQVERESLLRAAAQAAVRPDDARTLARQAVASFIWSTLVSPLVGAGRGAGHAAELRGARARARLLIRLVHGAEMATAARLCGYASEDAAVKSLTQHKTIAALQRRARDNWRLLPGVARVARAVRASARRAVAARRQLRAVSQGGAAWGTAGYRRVTVRRWDNRGSSALGQGRGALVASERERYGLIPNPWAGEYLRALDSFQAARIRAKLEVKRLRRYLVLLDHEFQLAMVGWRRGWRR